MDKRVATGKGYMDNRKTPNYTGMSLYPMLVVPTISADLGLPTTEDMANRGPLRSEVESQRRLCKKY